MASNILNEITPFKYLSEPQRLALKENTQRRDFGDGDTVIEQGCQGKEVFLLLEGQVSILDVSRRPEVCIRRIGPRNYFGERSALFGDERRFQVVANGHVCCLVMSGETFLDVIQQSIAFAQALARNLRQKQNLFVALEVFHAAVNESVANGVLDLSKLLKSYRQLAPALHPGAVRSEIDTGAWLYAIRRLPENITQSFVMLLSSNLPVLLSRPGNIATPVDTKARRRAIWELTAGKVMVQLRDGQTDLIDLITNLCLHAVEARKIRKRIHSPHLMSEICSALEKGDDAQEAMLERIPVSPEELEGLRRIWPKNLLKRIQEMLIHHEDYSVFIDKALGNEYNADGAEIWTGQIRDAALELMGSLDDVEIDIISSNTHSVVNCLSPFVHKHSDAIEEWAANHAQDLCDAQFHNETDRLYALSYRYLKAHPELAAEVEKVEAKHGICTLDKTVFTGLQVDLLDLSKLDYDCLDPVLAESKKPNGQRLLVNIDYAFGRQAEDILGCLILLFGTSIRSINILGKAGALCGERGDILLPTHVLNQSGDDIFSVGNEDLQADVIESLSGVSAHVGPVLTVGGTLLQNRVLLHYYRKLWRCVGLEMEGSYYAKQIERSKLLGMLSPQLKTRFLYYVSDLPLEENQNLSTKLAPWEGIPPLYATTRIVLKQILDA
jgi:CRP-like cAMP-binding protein